MVLVPTAANGLKSGLDVNMTSIALHNVHRSSYSVGHMPRGIYYNITKEK